MSINVRLAIRQFRKDPVFRTSSTASGKSASPSGSLIIVIRCGHTSVFTRWQMVVPHGKATFCVRPISPT